MLRKSTMALVVLALMLIWSCTVMAETAKFDFEDPLGEKWELQDAEITTEIAHSGERALHVKPRGQAIFNLLDEFENGFGRVTMWVYDTGITSDSDNATGPRWGLVNGWGDKFVICLRWRPFLDGNNRYSWISTAENSWFNVWDTGLIRSKGWHKFEFIYSEEETLIVRMDDKEEARLYKPSRMRFDVGFSGIYLYGGSMDQGLYVDDIEITIE